MARRQRTVRLPAPYLKRVWLDRDRVPDAGAYPFCLPLFRADFSLAFDKPITIIVGENGTGKSTLLEGIAAMAGYDDAGGGKGYRPVDHSDAIEVAGGYLSAALRASWLPKITSGWFFKAESFFSVARYLEPLSILARRRPTFFRTLMERGSSASSKSGATGRESSFSMSRSQRSRRPARFFSSGSSAVWKAMGIARSSWPRIHRC